MNKALSLEQLSDIEGGGWADFVDGLCIGVGTTAGAAALGVISLTGVGASVAAVASVGCGAWGVYRYYE